MGVPPSPLPTHTRTHTPTLSPPRLRSLPSGLGTWTLVLGASVSPSVPPFVTFVAFCKNSASASESGFFCSVISVPFVVNSPLRVHLTAPLRFLTANLTGQTCKGPNVHAAPDGLTGFYPWKGYPQSSSFSSSASSRSCQTLSELFRPLQT